MFFYLSRAIIIQLNLELLNKMKLTNRDEEMVNMDCCVCIFKSQQYIQNPADVIAKHALVICDGVFVVKGRKMHCLYDFNKKELYHIDDELLSDIEKNKDEYKNYFGSCKLAYASKIEPSLTFALIETTDLCNLKCIHCYEDAVFESKNFHFLTLENARFVIDELYGMGCKNVQFTGGEPMCNPEYKEIIRYAAGKMDNVELYSNCTLLTEEYAGELKPLGVTVALSMYSYDAMEHCFVTLNYHSHGKVEKAVSLLQKNGIKYRISTVLMNGVSPGEKGTCNYDLNMKQDTIRLIGRANAGLLNEDLLKKKIINKSKFEAKQNSYQVVYNMQRHNCYGYLCYITSKLDVNPCTMEKRISYGKLDTSKKGSLAALLHSKAAIQCMTKDSINGCQDCEFRYSCFDCRCDSLDTSFTDKPWYCAYNPETAEWNEQIVVDKMLDAQKKIAAAK